MLIRYPGSKAKLVQPILSAFPDEFIVPLFLSRNVHYVEPFFGSGAVGFAVMRRMHRDSAVTIADADVGLVCLWRSVLESPKALCKRIIEYCPTVESFYELQSSDGEVTDTVDTGFRKLALHKISYSGFGFMSGGPLGGRSQGSKYNVGCRWTAERMVRVVKSLHKLLSRFTRLDIRHQCVFDTIANAENSTDSFESTLIYLDPPYYEKGEQLYKHSFVGLHDKLAQSVRGLRSNWALSYDDHPTVRELYAGMEIRQLEVRYSNAVCKTATRPKNHEVLILPAKQGTKEIFRKSGELLLQSAK